MSLDLTGLLPTPEEVEAFVGDSLRNRASRTKTLGRAAARLAALRRALGPALARPGPLCRLSNGYSIDSERPMWPYRDWVIKALNDDMPFDQFTIEQLAGDLAAQRDQEPARRHGLSPQHADQRGRRHRPASSSATRRSSIASTRPAAVWLGLTVGCCPVPHAQVRSDHSTASTTSCSRSSTTAPT